MALALDPVVVAAVGLLVVGVIGSVVPLVPGAIASLAGVYLYWWHTGYAEPGLALLVVFTLVGGGAVIVDYFAGAISARAGGASAVTTGLAAVVGVVLFFVAGPLGVLLGVAGTVFLAELFRNRDPGESARTALYATAGVLASTAVQVVLTLSMLVVFLLVVL
jgi:uncharacterized protein YqgC (DUF456 family)